MLRAICIIAMFVAGAAYTAPVDLTSRESALRTYVGRPVHLCGRYFWRNNGGAYLATDRATVYLTMYPLRRFTQGQQICVTGVLHYWPKPKYNDGCLPDQPFFYFDSREPSFRLVPTSR